MIQTVREAWELWERLDAAVQSEEVPLEEAFGRVLAEDVIAGRDVPAFRRSPYDGYALSSEDSRGASRENPAVLLVNEEVPAGSVPSLPIRPGTATRVMTGAMLPEGADCVVKYELTEFTERELRIFSPLSPGNIVEIGEDVQRGERILEAGKRIFGGGAALAAGQGLRSLRVFRRPVVGILGTGDELCEREEELCEGKIMSTNGYLLSDCLRFFPILPRDFGIVRDSAEKIAERIEEALKDCDLLLTTGGVCTGDYDCLPEAMERLSAEIFFHGLPFKPGGALLCGRALGKPVFCLSGNPGSAATALLYVCAPYLRKLCGLSEISFREGYARMSEDFPKPSRRTRILKGRLSLSEELCFEPLSNQRNGAVSSMEGFDLLAEIPAGTPPLRAGDRVKIYQIRGG